MVLEKTDSVSGALDPALVKTACNRFARPVHHGDMVLRFTGLLVALIAGCASAPRAEAPMMRQVAGSAKVKDPAWPARAKRVEALPPAVPNDGLALAEAAGIKRGRVVVTSTCGITILDPACVGKTYPGYWQALASLGVKLEGGRP